MLGVTQDVISGMTEEQAKATQRRDRPMMVFVYDDSKDDEQRFLVEKSKAFADDNVAVGARFFDCLRIDLESAKEDRALMKKVKRGPSLVFLRPDYSVFKVISGKFSAKKVFAVMNAAVKKDYENCPHCVAREQFKLAQEWVRVDRGYMTITQLRQKAKDESNAKKRAELVKRQEAVQKDIADLESKLGEREAKLYELVPKAKKKT